MGVSHLGFGVERKAGCGAEGWSSADKDSGR